MLILGLGRWISVSTNIRSWRENEKSQKNITENKSLVFSRSLCYPVRCCLSYSLPPSLVTSYGSVQGYMHWQLRLRFGSHISSSIHNPVFALILLLKRCIKVNREKTKEWVRETEKDEGKEEKRKETKKMKSERSVKWRFPLSFWKITEFIVIVARLIEPNSLFVLSSSEWLYRQLFSLSPSHIDTHTLTLSLLSTVQ